MEKKYIIYGYSSIGEAVYQECMRREMEVICFCEDSKIRKENSKDHKDIYSLEEIVAKGIIGEFIIGIPNAKVIIDKLKKYGFSSWRLIDDFLQKDNYEKEEYTIKSRDMAIREIESCILGHKYMKDEKKIFLRSIDFEITEKCSMRCRDCSNLMQYYTKPENFQVDTLEMWLQNLLEYVDEIYEIRLIGGEPFMHKEMDEIIHRIFRYPQIHRIAIYSNATMMPSEKLWDTLQDDRIGFSITDYGKLSRNLSAIKDEMDKRHIAYDIHEMGGWTQCSNISKHNRNKEELQEIYKDCCAKNLITLLKGRLYKCPYIANGINLKALPDVKDEYIDLNELKKFKKDQAKRMIQDYLNKKDMFVSCDYCEGRSFGAEEIEPAVQINKPRDYEKVGDLSNE